MALKGQLVSAPIYREPISFHLRLITSLCPPTPSTLGSQFGWQCSPSNAIACANCKLMSPFHWMYGSANITRTSTHTHAHTLTHIVTSTASFSHITHTHTHIEPLWLAGIRSVRCKQDSSGRQMGCQVVRTELWQKKRGTRRCVDVHAVSRRDLCAATINGRGVCVRI